MSMTTPEQMGNLYWDKLGRKAFREVQFKLNQFFETKSGHHYWMQVMLTLKRNSQRNPQA